MQLCLGMEIDDNPHKTYIHMWPFIYCVMTNGARVDSVNYACHTDCPLYEKVGNDIALFNSQTVVK